MNKFLLRILLFVLLFWASRNFLNSLLPYHWGNPWYSTKIRYLEEQDSLKFNTYFLELAGCIDKLIQINLIVF